MDFIPVKYQSSLKRQQYRVSVTYLARGGDTESLRRLGDNDSRFTYRGGDLVSRLLGTREA